MRSGVDRIFLANENDKGSFHHFRTFEGIDLEIECKKDRDEWRQYLTEYFFFFFQCLQMDTVGEKYDSMSIELTSCSVIRHVSLDLLLFMFLEGNGLEIQCRKAVTNREHFQGI